MDNLSVYTLVMMVRGFDNEVTVNWLATQLGISYSTLARCKNGIWPRSVTFNAMMSVFSECRERFFGGDANALAESALGYLSRKGIDTAQFCGLLADEGPEACMAAIVAAAQTGKMPQRSIPSPNTLKDRDDRAGVSAERADGLAGYSPASALMALPIAAILLIGLLNMPLGELFGWMADNMLAFAATLIAIALSTVFVGVVVDAPLAWRAYRRLHPDARFSWHDFAAVSRCGDVDHVVAGAGRFDMSSRHCIYQALCNVLGALCSISLFAYLTSLAGFAEFFQSHEWTEFFKVGIAVGFFVAYGHNRDLRSGAPLESVDDCRENPDAYRSSRAHVWANSAHLVCTFSLVCIFTLALLAYSFASYRALEPSLLLLWPYAQTILFLWYSCLSPYAERIESSCVGAFAPGAIASSVGVAMLVAICYLPSWKGIVICLVCLACAAVTLGWKRRCLKTSRGGWISSRRQSSAYSIAVVASLALMLAIGTATSTLL